MVGLPDAGPVRAARGSRLFWRARRASPKEVCRRLRVERAQQLMARSALTLEEVAHECGYAHASHFCRDDKAEPGLTPTPWRRKLIDRFTEPLPPAVAPVREYGARASERVMPAKEMTDCGGRSSDCGLGAPPPPEASEESWGHTR